MAKLLPPRSWRDLASQDDLVAVRGEVTELRGEMTELRGEMTRLRGDLSGQIVRLYAASVASMVCVAGAALAAENLLL